MAIVATGNHVNTGMKEVSRLYIELDVLPGEDRLIKKAVGTGFEAILRTNYRYEIKRALCPDFRITIGSVFKYRKNL